jgi:hypothetical protein
VQRFAALFLLVIGAAPAGAQIMSVPRGSLSTEPAVVLTVTAGLLSLQSVADGRSGTIWDFSQAAQLGASLEKSLGKGVSFGVAATYANVPLHYLDTADVNAGFASCCDAHANVLTGGLQFTSGGGAGFHQLIVVNAGVIVFQHFDVKNNGTASFSGVPPKRDIDPRLAIGYGFGYGFSARSEAFILQEYGVALHQSDGLPGGTRRQYQQQTTRIGFRVGAGSH